MAGRPAMGGRGWWPIMGETEDEQPGRGLPQAGYGRLGLFPPLAWPCRCVIVRDSDGTIGSLRVCRGCR